MNDRFHDNPNGVITDTQNQIEWLPKDSYLDLGCWRTWQDAKAYVLLMNQVYAGGHSDWRLPTGEEALALFDPQTKLVDWEGKEIHISTVFVPKCGHNIWTSDVNEDDQVLRVD
ncbi:MAG: DUF1566 domain-containing protein, partial [Nitrospinales bacterium]